MVHIPQVTYKPSVNCAYFQLVNRIQGTQAECQETSKPFEITQTAFNQMTYEQQQYYQYYFAQQYYEYYKHMTLQQQGEGCNTGQFVPPADFQTLDPNIQSYIQQIAYNQYLQHQQNSTNSYAQIVSNVNRDGHSSTVNLPQLPEETINSNTNVPVVSNEQVQITKNKPLLSLAAAYNSNSDSDSDTSDEADNDPKQVYKIPSGEIRVVIDKLALYVSKNGERFEGIVKNKGDPRFEFLNDDHEFNKYYREQIKQYKKSDKHQERNDLKQTKKEKKVISPVSFSIKKSKEDHPKEIKSALPVEESDEEEDCGTVSVPSTLTQTTSSSLASVLLKHMEVQNKQKDMLRQTEKTDSSSDTTQKNGLDTDDPLLEMMEFTNETEDKKESKRAEDKIKDKLAAAAREKLAIISKDKALQLERKRKAAEFLKLKSTESCSGEIPPIEKPKSEKNSIEIIDITMEKEPEKDKSSVGKERSWSREVEYQKNKSQVVEKNYEKRRRHRSRSRSKDKGRRKDNLEDERDSSKKRKSDRKDRKKAYKRKHSKHRSKSKKKSKKQHRRFDDSEKSNSSSSL